MNEYKRVTIRNEKQIPSVYKNSKYIPLMNVSYIDILNQLGELEDKIEQGLLIELPCKVGDKIYYLFQCGDKRILPFVREAKVRKIYCANTENQFLIDCECPAEKEVVLRAWFFNDFGKTIFLTKAEAEAKLQELKGEQK